MIVIEGIEYWNTLRSSFNDEVGNHFYTYICNLKELVSLDKIPKTDLKNEIINVSSSSTTKFLRFIRDQIICYKKYNENLDKNLLDIQDDDNDNIEYDKNYIDILKINEVRSADIYIYYKCWCSENGEHSLSTTKFGLEAKHIITAIYNLTKFSDL